MFPGTVQDDLVYRFIRQVDAAGITTDGQLTLSGTVTTTGGTDADASGELALLQPFEGERCVARPGDLLYLPPNVPHWGTANDACLTYSIGMRAPRLSDLRAENATGAADPFYADPDLRIEEVRPGYISPTAIERAVSLLSGELARDETAMRLGCFVTRNKDWLRPDGVHQDVFRRHRAGHPRAPFPRLLPASRGRRRRARRA